MKIRKLDKSWASRINEVDRSEDISLTYKYRGGRLIPEHVKISFGQWEGKWLDSRIERIKKELDRGGTFLGAFEKEKLAGFALIGGRFIGSSKETIQLVLLHVSREYRGKGAGAKLFREVCALAKKKGARRLFISSAPTESAVGFYARQGAKPVGGNEKGLEVEEKGDIPLVLEFWNYSGPISASADTSPGFP
jgi:GNAT superfamily N-acetyltransferase